MIRVLDILFSSIGLLILSPFFLIIAFFVLLNSKGPVFYCQNRVGKNNRDFLLFKFRTMVVNSEIKGLLTVGSVDPRITGTGAILRKYKLDELPQLLNVLAGSMSLVGPRPEVRKYVELYNEEQKKILKFKPGITDYASIVYRNENDLLKSAEDPEELYIKTIMPEKIKMNMVYLNNPGMIKYFKIIFLTFFPGLVKYERVKPEGFRNQENP